MTLPSFVEGDEFTFRIFKRLLDNPQVEWTNTYEMHALGTGFETELRAIISNLLSFEQALHYASIEFTRGEVSTWLPDSHPYDPTAFYVMQFDAGTVGGISIPAATEVLPLTACLHVARNAVTGRLGKLYFRGCLVEDDVEGFAGAWVLSDPSGMSDRLDTAKAAVESYFSAGIGGNMKFRMIGKVKGGATFSRQVNNFSLVGVADVQLKHKWFNRAPAAAPGD